MRNVTKTVSLIVGLLIFCIIVMSCTQAERVSTNVSKEADNFNVCRRITVINSRTDTVIYELEGVFSLSNGYNNEL